MDTDLPIENIPLEKLDSCRSLPLDKQADMLLNVLATEVFDRKMPRSIDEVAKAIDGRQTFCNVFESMCRPLSKDETRRFAALVILKIVDCIRSLGR